MLTDNDTLTLVLLVDQVFIAIRHEIWVARQFFMNGMYFRLNARVETAEVAYVGISEFYIVLAHMWTVI